MMDGSDALIDLDCGSIGCSGTRDLLARKRPGTINSSAAGTDRAL
jgi:hypothetical protein